MLAICSKSVRFERGSSLMEALVGTLIMGIVFAGLMTVLSRTLVSQRYMNAKNTMLLDMRETLQSQGLDDICTNGASQLALGGKQVPFDAATCGSPAINISIPTAGLAERTLPANTVPAVSVNLSTSSNNDTQSLFGGDGVVNFSY